jgi:bifunctional UDP-N-acetylglucosamine pyrophosphorylase / glucosamine-1-phosphate N-acetyltransferase
MPGTGYLEEERPLKAVILAAGEESVIGAPGAEGEEGAGMSLLLQPLGDRRVIDYVVRNALQVVRPEDLYVIVPREESEIEAHLDNPAITFVVQRERLGTGHAVLQLQPLLPEYEGDLLILYGDTPLFRTTSIQGLLNRHRLKQAHLTLLTAVVSEPLPYGHIIRDAGGRIIDIIEETEASAVVREIRELNMGAYIVQAPAIFAALRSLVPSPIDANTASPTSHIV